MALDLSSGPLINAGGASLFLLAGIAILVVARQSRLGLRLGAFAVTFGSTYVLSNLLPTDSVVAAAISVAVGLVTAFCLGGLILEVVRTGPPRARPAVGILAAAVGLGAATVLGVVAVLELQDPGILASDGPRFFPVFTQQFLIEPLLLVLLAACGQAPVGGSVQQHKGRVLLGLSTALFAVDIIMVTAAHSNAPGSADAVVDGVEILLAVLVASTAWLVLRGGVAGAERFSRRVFGAIILVGLLGCLQVFAPQVAGIGPFGILRTVGAALLVLAVVKHDVLGVPLPRLVVRRGALAGGALAVLFIVAQVAQNFFSARYGLLMGGVLAGGFVFAASPVQRAIERYSDRTKPATASDAAHAGYKAALRAAMRDGTLTRREERHLAEVAMALGVSPVQALDLRDEVERESA